MKKLIALAGPALIMMGLAACGGGGGSTPPTTPQTSAPVISIIPTTPPPGTLVSGNVVSFPAGAFGPTAAPQAPLANATVVIGPVLIAGATPPATLPTGDVQATTDAAGRYVATLTAATIAPSSTQALFMSPPANSLNTQPPTNGYYVSVFASDTDGKSAGTHFPVHGFTTVAGGALATQRLSIASIDEAGFLALVNSDRVSNGSLPLIFDETAEEAARQHASDEASQVYYCHYDTHNVGPESRYLALLGLGGNGENLGVGNGTVQNAYTFVEGQFTAEKGSDGPHYSDLVDTRHVWAGLAVAGTSSAQFIDQELVTIQPSLLYIGYPVGSVGNGLSCPAGTTQNNS